MMAAASKTESESERADEGIQINGVAHVILTVSQRDLAQTKGFYRGLCRFMGLTCVLDEDDPQHSGLASNYCLYYVGSRTALGIARATGEDRLTTFRQSRCGLHHLCFRARQPQQVEQLHHFLTTKLLPAFGGRIIHGPEQGGWAPGYYSVLFEDPDGIRLELNYVPGKGLLSEETPRVHARL